MAAQIITPDHPQALDVDGVIRAIAATVPGSPRAVFQFREPRPGKKPGIARDRYHAVYPGSWLYARKMQTDPDLLVGIWDCTIDPESIRRIISVSKRATGAA